MRKQLFKIGFSLFIFLLGVPAAFADSGAQALKHQNTHKPPLATIASIEATLRMPNGARALTDYVRYYSQVVSKQRKYIVATFVYDGSPGRIILVVPANRRLITDGGCDVIELRYSLTTQKIVSLLCNGVA